MGTPGKRADVDWERVEAQYRAGIMSLREIAKAHDDVVTEAAIRKRAKRDGWERDLEAKVRARTDALVRKEQVRTEVRTESPTEKQQIEVDAQVRARMEMSHRTDVPRARKLVMSLLAELESQTAEPELFAELGAAMKGGDDSFLSAAFDKVVSLSGRVTNVKGLAYALKTLIALERQAFRMDVPVEPGAGEGKQFTELELAAKMAYFLDLGRRREAEAAPTEG